MARRMNDGSHTAVPAIADLGPRFFDFVEKLTNPVAFLDLEATGTDVQRDRVIELSILRVSPLPVAIEAPKTWRIDPEMKIPSESRAIHGISNDDLADAPTFAKVAPEVIEMLNDADLAGFALTRMDIRMLQNEFNRVGVQFDLSKKRVLDSQVVYHQREPREQKVAASEK